LEKHSSSYGENEHAFQDCIASERSAVRERWRHYYIRGGRTGGYPLSPCAEIYIRRNAGRIGLVLDLCSGRGRSADYMRRLLLNSGAGDVMVIAMDLDRQALKSVPVSVHPVQGDMFCMPFPHVLFDLIHLRYGLEGYSNSSRAEALRSISGRLKPGGALALEVMWGDHRKGAELNGIDSSIENTVAGLKIMCRKDSTRVRRTLRGEVREHTVCFLLCTE